MKKGITVCVYFKVLSQLPVTKTFISGIQARALMGLSCLATVVGWAPDIKGHILTWLSQPPEKTVVPSSFQVEHKTGCAWDIKAFGVLLKLVLPLLCFIIVQHLTSLSHVVATRKSSFGLKLKLEIESLGGWVTCTWKK